MSYKSKKVGNTVELKVKWICLMFGVDSISQVTVMTALIKANGGMPLLVTSDNRKHLVTLTGLTMSALNVALHRLEQPEHGGIIRRKEKTIFLHPAFANLTECTGILIKFEPPDVIQDV